MLVELTRAEGFLHLLDVGVNAFLQGRPVDVVDVLGRKEIIT